MKVGAGTAKRKWPMLLFKEDIAMPGLVGIPWRSEEWRIYELASSLILGSGQSAAAQIVLWKRGGIGSGKGGLYYCLGGAKKEKRRTENASGIRREKRQGPISMLSPSFRVLSSGMCLPLGHLLSVALLLLPLPVVNVTCNAPSF